MVSNRVEAVSSYTRAMTRRLFYFVLAPAAVYVALYAAFQQGEVKREIRHAERPSDITERLLQLANVHRDDVVFDLECGDGTLALAAAREYRANLVCVDGYPRRTAEVQKRVTSAHLDDRITVKLADWRTLDLSSANVVVLFSPVQWDRSLRGHLTKQLRPGARIVAWLRNLGSWAPTRVMMFQGSRDRHPIPVMLWIADGKYRPQEFAEAPAPLIPAFQFP
jgi:mycolic acid cyclopropane synthetase